MFAGFFGVLGFVYFQGVSEFLLASGVLLGPTHPKFRKLWAAVEEHISREWAFVNQRDSSMDWQGQKLSEHLMQYLLLGSAIIAFLAGYLTSSYSTMLWTYLVGVIVTFLVTVPDWPFYNRKPLHWLEPMYADMPSTRQINKSKQQPPPSSGKKAAKPQGKR